MAPSINTATTDPLTDSSPAFPVKTATLDRSSFSLNPEAPAFFPGPNLAVTYGTGYAYHHHVPDSNTVYQTNLTHHNHNHDVSYPIQPNGYPSHHHIPTNQQFCYYPHPYLPSPYNHQMARHNGQVYYQGPVMGYHNQPDYGLGYLQTQYVQASEMGMENIGGKGKGKKWKQMPVEYTAGPEGSGARVDREGKKKKKKNKKNKKKPVAEGGENGVEQNENGGINGQDGVNGPDGEQ